MKKIFILLGIPGSGKGTQAKKLASKFGYDHVSTGDLLRALEADTNADPADLQKLADMKAGKLVSDDLIYKLAFARLNACFAQEKGVVLDGAIRSVDQAKAYQAFFEQQGMQDEVLAIELALEDKVIFERIQARIDSGQARPDDHDPKVIEQRIAKQGNAALQPIAQYYTEQNQLVKIDGSQSIEEVEESIEEVVREML